MLFVLELSSQKLKRVTVGSCDLSRMTWIFISIRQFLVQHVHESTAQLTRCTPSNLTVLTARTSEPGQARQSKPTRWI